MHADVVSCCSPCTLCQSRGLMPSVETALASPTVSATCCLHSQPTSRLWGVAVHAGIICNTGDPGWVRESTVHKVRGEVLPLHRLYNTKSIRPERCIVALR